jgi:type II secretory pathway component PulF
MKMLQGLASCTAFSVRQRILFLRQLALILQSGLPLLQAMVLLQERLPRRLRPICYHVLLMLRHGSGLAEAMARERASFPDLTLSLVSAGELSGQLSEVLEELATYYAEQDRLKRSLLEAALYPLLLLGAALGVFLFFLLYVLPMLANVYAGMRVRPTGTLLRLLLCRELLTQYWYILLLGGGALCLWLRGQGGRLALWGLSRGCCGDFYRLLFEVRFCKVLALLLESGLSITRAVATIAETMLGSRFEQEMRLLNARLARGSEIATALGGMSSLLSGVTLDLLSVGAATGCLPQMLREAGRLGEQELQGRLARLRELIAPLLLIVVACVCATVLVAVLGPLLELLTVLPE